MTAAVTAADVLGAVIWATGGAILVLIAWGMTGGFHDD